MADGVTFGFQTEDAKSFPPIVVLETTNVCNLRCIHCPQGNGYPDSPDYRPHYMSWETYTKVIDEIAENKVELVRFAPAGEALVHPQFLDQIAYAKSKGVGPIDLTTNGLTFDNDAFENGAKMPGISMMQRLLELEIDVVDISVDAFSKERHEQIRVGSDYHRLMSNIHHFLYLRNKGKHKTRLMLSIIDQPEAGDEVELFRKYWEPHVDRVLVRPYVANLGMSGTKDGDIVSQYPDIERWPCPQFWKRVTISTEGYIRFCVVDWANSSALADVATSSISEVWRNSDYDRMRGCHMRGEYDDAHDICGPCTDWMGMRWDWTFEMAIRAAFGDKTVADRPRPLDEVYGRK